MGAVGYCSGKYARDGGGMVGYDRNKTLQDTVGYGRGKKRYLDRIFETQPCETLS